MSSKINLQTCEYARKSSIFQDNQLIFCKVVLKFVGVCYNERIDNKTVVYKNIIQNKQQRGWDYEIYY